MLDEPQDFLGIKEAYDLNLALSPQVEVVAGNDARKEIGDQRPQTEGNEGDRNRGKDLAGRVTDAAHQNVRHQAADQNGGADEKVGAKNARAAGKPCKCGTPVGTGERPAAAEEGGAGKGEFGRFKNGFVLLDDDAEKRDVPNAGRTDGKPQNGRQTHGAQFAHETAEKRGEDGTDPSRQRALLGDDFAGGKGKEPACGIREVDGDDLGEQSTLGRRP